MGDVALSKQTDNTTRTNSASQLENLPTLHPELEGYTPGEFSLRISKTICQGLSSQQSKLRSNNRPEHNVLTRKESLNKSFQQFEDIIKKREDILEVEGRRQISSKSGRFSHFAAVADNSEIEQQIVEEVDEVVPERGRPRNLEATIHSSESPEQVIRLDTDTEE